METGYAKAKLVCKRVVEQAWYDYSTELKVTCTRFGQVAGQVAGAKSTGYWNLSEHMVALIKSSEKLGKLPCLQAVRIA